ncbi:hypothetical protein SAMN05216480_101475 [Pustulibacterium marinum]|uniref:DUF6265 domain-containing protein n=1 Tax=Pustulibacterium marinum TaxID=1224947 RepID=A0A1I7EZN5_9FLAO|nr:DUF6265 family protein [Pustulibacterium marinum]SFU29412.1 hypothetical protein SAMN05216480_101475 [Pustulibacterium marinum]
MNKIVFLVSVCCTVAFARAQHTLSFEEGFVSPKASLSQISWLSGYWEGEAFGGQCEEIWSNPLGDSMMFVFKLSVNGKTKFYESGGIRQVGETLILQLKHFDAQFHGWEAKDETVDFNLIKITPNKIYFDGFTIEKISENNIHMWVKIEEDKNQEEVLFDYKKK